MPQDALAVVYGVGSSTVGRAIGEVRPHARSPWFRRPRPKPRQLIQRRTVGRSCRGRLGTLPRPARGRCAMSPGLRTSVTSSP
ncbi:hypothetical protein [Streptomyces sp. NPDC005969]|uniref:hypothetical protein n=1 Tax=Streptomyces sp. NPDC005969 TaxID=3156722 RepID=UPI0033DBDACF